MYKRQVYRSQIELAGGMCVDVPTYAEENYAIDEARLRAAITPRTKAIIFNNPTNPTGMSYDRGTLSMLARIAQEYDLLVAADEIYTTYLYEGDFCPIRTLPGMAQRTITLNSFSKNYLMTGWRVGVIIAEPELQIIADPATEQPYRSCGGQRRQQTADCAAGRECFFHSPPFWQCAESYLLKSGAEAQRAACVPLYSTQAKNANHACRL